MKVYFIIMAAVHGWLGGLCLAIPSDNPMTFAAGIINTLAAVLCTINNLFGRD